MLCFLLHSSSKIDVSQLRLQIFMSLEPLRKDKQLEIFVPIFNSHLPFDFFIQSINYGKPLTRSFTLSIKFELSSVLSPRSANPCYAENFNVSTIKKHGRLSLI